MLVANRNRLFQIGNETRTIEIDDSIVRGYASDAEKVRENHTEVCDVLPFQTVPWPCCLNSEIRIGSKNETVG
jgi:hypothetical protein